MANLEYIEMPGVTELTGSNTLHFYKDYKLTKVVLGTDIFIYSTTNSFKVESGDVYTAQVDVYAKRGGTINLGDIASGKKMLTHKVYYYEETRPEDEATQAITWNYYNGVATLWSEIPA